MENTPLPQHKDARFKLRHKVGEPVFFELIKINTIIFNKLIIPLSLLLILIEVEVNKWSSWVEPASRR